MEKDIKDKYWVVTAEKDYLLDVLEKELVEENYHVINRSENILFITTALDVDSLIKENADSFTGIIRRCVKEYILFVDVSRAVQYYLENKKVDNIFFWHIRQAVTRGICDSSVLKGEYRDGV